MADFNLINDFAEQQVKGVHAFGTHTFKLFICAAANAPLVSNTVLADLTEIDKTNLSGGANPEVTISVSDETDTVLSADKITLTASGGALPTFRYYGIYNDSATSPADALVCFWDHGSDVTLADGESFDIKFNGADTGGTIMALGQGTIS